MWYHTRVGQKKKFYAVARGRRAGIYTRWEGEEGARHQIVGYPRARYRGFFTLGEAEKWLKQESDSPSSKTPFPPEGNRVIIYTDGGARHNPGPGGYAAVLQFQDKQIELSGGYRRTTNNRMELLGCIKALLYFDTPRTITLYTDSQYVANGINRGWAEKWRQNNWMRTPLQPAENADLWDKLLELTAFHQVTFKWIRGHAGQPENERCDRLVREIMSGNDLSEDRNFIEGRTRKPGFRF